MIKYLLVKDILEVIMEKHELGMKFINIIKKEKSPIQQLKELEQGENGILRALLLFEKEEKKEITPGDLCTSQNLTSGRIASTLKSLEKKAYIKRITDCKDHRRIFIQLTEKGRSIAKKITQKIHQNIQVMIDKLGEKDFSEFIRLLNLVNSNDL